MGVYICTDRKSETLCLTYADLMMYLLLFQGPNAHLSYTSIIQRASMPQPSPAVSIPSQQRKPPTPSPPAYIPRSVKNCSIFSL